MRGWTTPQFADTEVATADTLGLAEDGRTRLAPDARLHVVPSGTFPRAVSRATARAVIERFKVRGESFHSGMGNLVWLITTWARDQGVEVRLEAQYLEGRVAGYHLKRV